MTPSVTSSQLVPLRIGGKGKCVLPCRKGSRQDPKVPGAAMVVGHKVTSKANEPPPKQQQQPQQLGRTVAALTVCASSDNKKMWSAS